MNLEIIKGLLAYNKWANEQVFACVASAPQDIFKAEHDYSQGSLHAQYFHMMQSDWMSLIILEEGDLSVLPAIESYPDFDSIKSRALELEQELDQYVESLNSLDKIITISLGEPYSLDMTIRDFLMSSINHGTNHRAQILALLHKHGQETCEQGYFFYLMEREKEKVV